MAQLINPQVLQAILDGLVALHAKRDELNAEIQRLERAGCIDGYLKQTPTQLELHYCHSLRQSEPPPSRVILPAEETEIRIQIENYLHANRLRNHLKEVEYTIERTAKGFEEIKSYVESRVSQLVIPQLERS